MKVLHVIASPLGKNSDSVLVAKEFLNGFIEESRDLTVETVDLCNRDLPPITARGSDDYIYGFRDADLILISSPSWNFSVPYALKYYIDCLVQPGYTFDYDKSGFAFPLVSGKKVVVVTSRGEDYPLGKNMQGMDFQVPYLRAIFDLIGVKDVEFIDAHAVHLSIEEKKSAVQDACRRARALAGKVMEQAAVAV